MTATMAVIIGATWCLAPVWREYQEERRVDAICQQIERLKTVNMQTALQSLAHFEDIGFDQIRQETNGLTSVSGLNNLAARCIANCRFSVADDADVDAQIWSKWAIVCVFNRLSDIDSDLNARTLVDLYCRDDLPLDVADCEDIREALYRCRERALPYLTPRVPTLDEPVRANRLATIAWLGCGL